MSEAQRHSREEVPEWNPRTELGRLVKAGIITDIDEILRSGKPILESEIVDALLSTENELLLIGQSRGKFGGGQRRIFRQTQKKTREGNKPQFSTMAVVGDGNGHIGIGLGKSKETVPAREKAIKNAKKNLFLIRRGSGSWEDLRTEAHSIPYAVEGKCGSVKIRLMPAPKGKGLVAEKEVQKILKLAGIENVWSKSFGQTNNKINLINATEKALRKLAKMRVLDEHKESLKLVEGKKDVRE